MTKVEKVAGIDISKDFLDVCVMTKEGERQSRFTNDSKGFEQLKTWISEGTHCVMEVFKGSNLSAFKRFYSKYS